MQQAANEVFCGARRILRRLILEPPFFPGNLWVVRFLSSPLKNPGFPRVFRIPGQLLWSSVAPMQLGAWRLRRCISRRAPKIESFLESRWIAKILGFCMSRSGSDPLPWVALGFELFE